MPVPLPDIQKANRLTKQEKLTLSSSMHLPCKCLKQIRLEIKNHIVNDATDNVVQREIYSLVTREEAAAQLRDINSKILVNRILLFFGVPKEALSNGSAPTPTLLASQRPCAVGRPCPGKTRGYFRSYQVSALPMFQWEERLRKWGEKAQQSTCHLFIPLRINNSSLRIMRLNSNAFLCSCHEAKPRWRLPEKYQGA